MIHKNVYNIYYFIHNELIIQNAIYTAQVLTLKGGSKYYPQRVINTDSTVLQRLQEAHARGGTTPLGHPL
jgi:hypothetical protein